MFLLRFADHGMPTDDNVMSLDYTDHTVWFSLPVSGSEVNVINDIQGWTGVSKAARENVLNGPKFAKTIYLSIDNRPSKLRFGTALVLRMSSDVNLGEVVDPGRVRKIDFSRQILENFNFFQALSHKNF